jgi:hypothetical protein
MVRMIKEQVTIQPGGVIQIRRPELRAGDSAEIIVLVEDNSPPTRSTPTLASLFGKAKGSFASSEEADAFLRAEREAWDR